MLDARDLTTFHPTSGRTLLDDVCRRAIVRARAGGGRRVGYAPAPGVAALGSWDATALERALALLVADALLATRDGERVELRWRLERDEVVVGIEYPRPLGCAEPLVAFFDADAGEHEDRRRIVGARDAVLGMGGSLARVRTREGATYVVRLPCAARGDAARPQPDVNWPGPGRDVLRGGSRGAGGETMSQRIYIGATEARRLRALVEQYLEGRDAATAERLGEELERATIVEDGRIPSDAVTIGSRVRFEDETSGSVREVVLVYPGDADASAGRVSVLAPVGAALLGLRVGHRIEWPLPGGRTARIRIRAVGAPDSAEREAVA